MEILWGTYSACLTYTCTVESRYLDVDGTIFLQIQITGNANLFAFRVIWTWKTVRNAKLWLEKGIKLYYLSRWMLGASQNLRYPSSRLRFDCKPIAWSILHGYANKEHASQNVPVKPFDQGLFVTFTHHTLGLTCWMGYIVVIE